MSETPTADETPEAIDAELDSENAFELVDRDEPTEFDKLDYLEHLHPEHHSHRKETRDFDLDNAGYPAGGWLGWIGPLVAGLIAALLRLPNLGRPHALVFDETYYAKDALALLNYGYERKAVEGADQLLLDAGGNTHATIFELAPSYIVHPPVGKWLIALGESIFGASPFGWRIVMAILGVASVVLLARIGRRLFRSNVAGTVAGLLLALDGLHIVMSRTALLDTSLSFFILCAFACLIWDRDIRRHRTGFTWQRVGLTVSLGLACATKWSGIYYVLVFGVIMLSWDFIRRIDHADEDASRGSVVAHWLRHDVLSALSMPFVIVGIYLASWIGWFRSTDGWGRHWADTVPGLNWLPDPLRSLWHYHADMLSFHTHLTSAHSYAAKAWGWPLMVRPTSFFYESAPTCGADSCSQEVIPLGNPLIWWGGALALVLMGWFMAQRRHSAAMPILMGFIAGWLPWLFFPQRTVFTFYGVVFVPFTVLAFTLVLELAGRGRKSVLKQFHLPWTTVLALVIVAGLTWFFYPILVAQSITYDQWHLRMWFPTWI